MTDSMRRRAPPARPDDVTIDGTASADDETTQTGAGNNGPMSPIERAGQPNANDDNNNESRPGTPPGRVFDEEIEANNRDKQFREQVQQENGGRNQLLREKRPRLRLVDDDNGLFGAKERDVRIVSEEDLQAYERYKQRLMAHPTVQFAQRVSGRAGISLEQLIHIVPAPRARATQRAVIDTRSLMSGAGITFAMVVGDLTNITDDRLAPETDLMLSNVASAYRDVLRSCPNLRAVKVEQLKRKEATLQPFAELVAAHVLMSRSLSTRVPSHQYNITSYNDLKKRALEDLRMVNDQFAVHYRDERLPSWCRSSAPVSTGSKRYNGMLRL